MRSKRLQKKDEAGFDDWKDRQLLRENPSATSQHRSSRGVLKDYSLKHRVSMEYDMNKDSERDRMFVLKIDDYSAIIDYEELMRIGRFI